MAIVGNVGRVLSLEPEPDPRSVNCVIRELQKRKSLVLEKQFFQNNFFNILKGLLEVCENKSENFVACNFNSLDSTVWFKRIRIP